MYLHHNFMPKCPAPGSSCVRFVVLRPFASATAGSSRAVLPLQWACFVHAKFVAQGSREEMSPSPWCGRLRDLRAMSPQTRPADHGSPSCCQCAQGSREEMSPGPWVCVGDSGAAPGPVELENGAQILLLADLRIGSS
ncbi:hypothetical protein COCON_G00071360 [Conger conger]|uniref:Uncharacterized protein n=1 Tax=Conger conger TaxID=82655 RepID=A0A9Q1I4G3_CONCO|nr:hypothetical protein COCON_G00071360 [Conger conger]